MVWFTHRSAALVAAVALLVPGSAAAQVSLETGCLEELSGSHVRCTANDIEIAGVATDADGNQLLTVHDDGCAFPGDTVHFTATFELSLSATARHDVGIYFVRDDDANGDGARSGECTVSTIPFAPDPPWLDLDGTTDPFPGTNDTSNVQDQCGDIDRPEHDPLFPELTMTVLCIDHDLDGLLDLPNCVSWRQPGANDLCLGPLDAFPGSPSKCNCDYTFGLPIEVPPAEIQVTKTASPTSLAEPGGPVTFSVEVTNSGIDPANGVTLDSPGGLSDDIYGDITLIQGAIQSTTCAVPQRIEAGSTYSCSFVAFVEGNGGYVITDVVTASGVDDRKNPVTGEDDASVSILDVLPSINVVKTATPAELLEPGGTVVFNVLVENTSPAASDTVTIDSLVDDVYGDLVGKGDCSLPQAVAPGSAYECSFEISFSENAGFAETDTVTAQGADDEGNPVSHADSATVVVNDVPSSISIVKTATPSDVLEPGGVVQFVFTLSNDSAVDSVVISSMVDSVLGSLAGQGTCSVPQSLAPGDIYSCALSAWVAGNAGEAQTNTVTASGIDDDGNPVEASDNATVNILNAPPAATLTKVAMSAEVTYEVTVTNDSTAEPLTLDSLVDDAFGDVADSSNPLLVDTNCATPQTLGAKGEPDDTYSCTFRAMVTTSPHTNTLVGTVLDDDGSAPIEPSDSAEVTFD